MIRIGPSGWAYKDWEGIVYPSKKPKGFDRLTFLSQYFDAVEINTSFAIAMGGRGLSERSLSSRANSRF
jgi:hypothetical protein